MLSVVWYPSVGDYDSLYPKRVRLLFYDIETAPLLSYHWAARTDYIGHTFRVDDDRMVLCWSAKWSDGQKVHSKRVTKSEALAQDDERIVAALADLMREADYVIAHNGNRFDYKRVNTRLLVNRLAPLGNVQTIDTLLLARQSFDLPWNRLDYLAQKLGFGGKIETDFELWRRAVHGDVAALKELESYNRRDVVLLEHVFHAMTPYVKTLPRLVDAAEWREELCPYCGSEKRKKAGYYRTKVNTFPKWRCRDCGREYRGWQAVGSMKAGSIGL